MLRNKSILSVPIKRIDQGDKIELVMLTTVYIQIIRHGTTQRM